MHTISKANCIPCCYNIISLSSFSLSLACCFNPNVLPLIEVIVHPPNVTTPIEVELGCK
jgi:hypothetical protein